MARIPSTSNGGPELVTKPSGMIETPDGYAAGFAITMEVGRVIFGEGDKHPHVVAMMLIGEHGAPGTYTFPTESGGACAVTVEFSEAPAAPRDY